MKQNCLPDGEQIDDIQGRHEPVSLDARQRLVFRALADVHSKLGSLYLGAVHVLRDPLNPVRGRQAAYSLRDICTRIHEYLGDSEGNTRAKHHASMLKVTPSDPLVRHFLGVCKQLEELAHFEGPDKEPPKLEDVVRALRNVEDILLALLGPFYEVFPDIDELLAIDVPTDDDIQKLETLLARPGPARRAYFFDNLQKPGWLGPLREAGFFSNPPEPVHNKEEGTIAFRPWPESRYLARMAEHEPKAVHDIILGILSKRSDIENTPVLADFVDAAMTMPADQAVNIAEYARKWTRRYDFLLPEKLAQLMKKLAEEGQKDEALRLAGSLLSLRADDSRARTWREKHQHVSQSDPWADYEPPPEARARVDEHQYRHVIEEHFPSVVEAVGLRAVELLCDLLAKAINIGLVEVGGPDYSHVWRPAVEDHQQNLRFTMKEDLVEAIRDMSQWLIENRPDEAKEVLEKLEARPSSIFQRIALYMLSWKPGVDPQRAAERLCDQNVFEDHALRHEYYLLAQSYFHRLEPQEQEKIIGWIEAGPDEQESATNWDGTRRSQEEIDKYRQWWKRDKLALFKGVLPAEWESKYEALVAEVGEPEHPEFISYQEMRMGIPSPKSAEELNEMTTPELVQFLADWEPPEDEVWGPAPEGLGQELQRAVEADPNRYAQDAEQFEGLYPTYVRNLLEGLVNACRAGNAFPWQPVLNLCAWVVEQPDLESRGPTIHPGDADPDWEWTRGTIASLLREGLGGRQDEIAFRLRDLVWRILYPLTNDPNPTPEYEETYGGANMSPAGLAINTVRGKAMHAVVAYALWCTRHLRPNDQHLTDRPPILQEIPEVDEVLDYHLDPKNDPSAAIRSVYGHYLPWLVLLIAEWVQANLARIFPKEPKYRYLWEAAWGSYVILNRPYDNVADILKDEYGVAVDKLGEQGVGAWRGPGPEKRLAQHLMLLYWRGRLSIEDSLIGQFFLKASPDVRAAALTFIGRGLQQMDEAIPLDHARRLCDLLESRIAAAQQDEDKEGVQEELSNFGWWFASARLQDEWAVERLRQVLELTDGVIEPNRLVAERLALLASDQPSAVVACLTKMVDGDREGWRILGWREHARTILSAALSNGQEEAQSSARDIINGLGERGFHEFRDLLE